jgi:regulator of sirC expression with transglutaminase-like and TPR domain
MNSSDRLDRIEAILAATAVQQQANTEALTRLEARTLANTEAIASLETQTSANTAAIDRLTDRLDSLAGRVDRIVTAIQSHQEALRLLSQQQNDWRDQMRLLHVEIRDIWQYLNNQLRNRGNGDGGLPGE